MEKYEIKTRVEFNAKDFAQAKKVQGKIEECIIPLLLEEGAIRSWEIILQKKERERL